MVIGVDLFSRLGGGGGDDRCPMRGSEATERGGGCGRGIPPSHGRDLKKKIRVSKLHFRALKKRFYRELKVVKFHGEELTKELFVEYRLKTIASLARVLRMYIYMDLSKKFMFL